MRRRSRVTNFAAGITGVVILVVICYLVFGGSLPFSSSPYELKAVFTSNTQLHIPSEVRTAGVKVGEVVSVTRMKDEPPTSQTAVVTMDIQNNGLPIHADATVNIRPRIFLEGNFYVDLSPGTPSAPTLASGSTLAAPQTSGPVQLDRVLADLTSDARANLQTLLQGIGGALNAPAVPSIDATQDPIVRGLTGGQALNLSLKYSVDAFRATAMVNQALLGIQPNDLAGVVKGNAAGVQRAVGEWPAAAGVRGLVQHDDGGARRAPATAQPDDRAAATVAAGHRSTAGAAERVVRADEGVRRRTDPRRRAARPDHRRRSDRTAGWLQQSIDLVSNKYLGGLLKDLTPAVQNTSASLTATQELLQQSDLFAQCFTHNLLPAGNQYIQDPPGGTTGRQVYQEFFQSAVGLAGSAQNFDGNGRYMRASAGGGSDLFQTSVVPGAGPLFGNAVLPPLGTRPAYPGHAPPVVENVACFKNPVPKLNNVSTGQAP